MTTTGFLFAMAAVSLAGGCAQFGGQGSPQIRAQAAQACAGSGFPAIGSIAAPGVPCNSVEGMQGGPPHPL